MAIVACGGWGGAVVCMTICVVCLASSPESSTVSILYERPLVEVRCRTLGDVCICGCICGVGVEGSGGV